jgi:hypothetical protein
MFLFRRYLFAAAALFALALCGCDAIKSSKIHPPATAEGVEKRDRGKDDLSLKSTR